jgi:hypothetical protein
MKAKNEELRFREVGKGFILRQLDGIVGRTLTQTYMDQHKKIYVKINDNYTPLTEQHNFLVVR